MPRYIDADALKNRMLNYYDCVNENTGKSNYRGETLMNYEVADMIEDCIDNAPTADVVELPCKVGDTVWFIRDGTYVNKNNIIETKVNKIVIKHSGIYLQLACNSLYETSCKSIGKSVFFTKEEADEANERIQSQWLAGLSDWRKK